ncbi:M24 family metallopeptidase [Methylobacterium oryzae CBMB20]
MDHGAYPASLLYRGYPKSICTSINHVVCHGIPNDKPLREGDIVNLDICLILDGLARRSRAGWPMSARCPRKAQRLCEITYEALMRGVAAVKPGGSTNDIGRAIQSYAEGERCSVVRDFCGHGLGRTYHDAPTILHYVEAELRRAVQARPVLHRSSR